MKFTDRIRPAAVAGAFYPEDPRALRAMIGRQLDHARALLTPDVLRRLPDGAPKAVIVPHAGYVYSGTTAALAYALLERGRGTIRRAVIVGPTHRIGVRGVAMCRARAFATPLGEVPVDVDAESRAFDGGLTRPSDWRENTRAAADSAAPALMVHDATHAQEHAVEVQIPFLQTVLGPDIEIVPLNAGSAAPDEVGDVLRAFWGGPETVIVISSDLSHYHPHEFARVLDDETIARIAALDLPIHPDRACGAHPVNGLLDVCRRGVTAGDAEQASSDEAPALDLRFLGCCTSGDRGDVVLSDALLGREPDVNANTNANALAHRPPVPDPDEAVVGYASFAMWAGAEPRGPVLLGLARAAIRRHLGLDAADDSLQSVVDRHPWLGEPGASFVTLTEGGRLRGCIGTLEAHRPLGRDVADHAVDAASRDPRFRPVTADEYPLLDVEVSVLSKPEPMAAAGRAELEAALRPGVDGLILDAGGGRRATFLPQVWDELPDPHDFVSHLLAKAGLPSDLTWSDARLRGLRYTVTAYREE